MKLSMCGKIICLTAFSGLFALLLLTGTARPAVASSAIQPLPCYVAPCPYIDDYGQLIVPRRPVSYSQFPIYPWPVYTPQHPTYPGPYTNADIVTCVSFSNW